MIDTLTWSSVVQEGLDANWPMLHSWEFFQKGEFNNIQGPLDPLHPGVTLPEAAPPEPEASEGENSGVTLTNWACLS